MPYNYEELLTFNFYEMSSKEIKAASRGKYPLAFLIVSVIGSTPQDTDPQKTEELVLILCSIARTLLRETDICFRFGGESIVVLLPFADKAGMDVVFNKLNGYFCTNSIVKQKNTGYNLAMTGVTYPDDGRARDKLLDKLEEKYLSLVKKCDS